MPFSRRSGKARAFTLLELIVVIVILGVLAAIAIPTFLAAQEKSRAAVAAETLSAEDRDARALMTLRNDGSTVPSADDYATAASELQASGLGVLAASGRRLYIPASAASSVTNSLSNVSTYSVAPQLNVGEMTLSLSGGAAGLATLTSGDTCVLLADSGGVPVIQTKTHLGANCNGATALLSSSSLASVSYLAAASSPTAPTLAGVWGNQSVALSWTAPASNGANITGYNLYQNNVKISTLASTATSASVTGLTNGMQYSFTLSALNAVGEGSQSGALSLTPATLPSAPAAPSLTPGVASIAVSWTAPASNGAAITGYNVYVGGGKVNSSPITGTSYTLTGLQNGTQYSVAVSAVNAAGEGPLSGTSVATTYSAPGAPTAATASLSGSSSTVSWAAPAFNGGSPVTGYTITRQSTNMSSATVTNTTLSTTSTSLTDTIVNGESVKYLVAAVNVVGTGPTSATTAVATTALTNTAPVSANTLLTNGGFESGTANWAVMNASGYITNFVTYSSSQATGMNNTVYAGGTSGAANTTGTGANQGSVYQDVALSWAAGTQHCVSLMVESEDPTRPVASGAHITLWALGNTANEPADASFTNLPGSGNWLRASVCLTPTGAHTTLRFQVYLPTYPQTVWMDDARAW